MYFRGWCCCTAASLTFAVGGSGHQDVPLTQHTYTHHVRSQQKQHHNTHTHASQAATGVQRDSMHLFPLFFSISSTAFYYLISMGFSLAMLLCHRLFFSLQFWSYKQYHLQTIKSNTLSFFLAMCLSGSPFLFFSFIWSSLLYPSLFLSCTLPSVCEALLAQILR